jgi:hypothetical protein
MIKGNNNQEQESFDEGESHSLYTSNNGSYLLDDDSNRMT